MDFKFDVKLYYDEEIEDEYDLRAYKEAIEEYNKNPISYSHEEVLKILEIE